MDMETIKTNQMEVLVLKLLHPKWKIYGMI